MFFKVYHNFVDIPLPPTITPAFFIGRRDHSRKLTIPEANVDAFKYSFYPRTVRIWNTLSYVAVTKPSPATFREAAVPTIRSMQPPRWIQAPIIPGSHIFTCTLHFLLYILSYVTVGQ